VTVVVEPGLIKIAYRIEGCDGLFWSEHRTASPVGDPMGHARNVVDEWNQGEYLWHGPAAQLKRLVAVAVRREE
jgi:hypothetical protein